MENPNSPQSLAAAANRARNFQVRFAIFATAAIALPVGVGLGRMFSLPAARPVVSDPVMQTIAAALLLLVAGGSIYSAKVDSQDSAKATEQLANLATQPDPPPSPMGN